MWGRLPEADSSLPVAELAGETDLGAAVEAGGGVDVDVGGMAETGADFAEGVDEGYVFERLDGGQAAGAAVDFGSAGEGCAEMLEVARPGVGGVGVEEVFE